MRSLAIFLCLLASLHGAAQEVMQSSRGGGSVQPGNAGASSALYRQLRDVALDPQRVYRIREANIDREDIHLTLEDGTIAFLQAVDGRVTGAFFSGTGEILLRPPDRVERTSLQLFTGAAILEETFDNAFIRFNDQTADELKPYLRPPEDPQAFVDQWNETVHSLAESDVLRLVTSYLNTPARSGAQDYGPGTDHLLHARLEGEHLGVFDVFYDSEAAEPVSAGGLATKNGMAYFDEWTSFRSASMRKTNFVQPLRVEIESYRVRATLEPPERLSAETEVKFRVGTPGQKIMFFELSRFLKLSSVSSNGEQLEFLQNEALEGTALSRRGNDLVGVIFPTPPAAGTELSLKFVYSGAVLGDAGGGLLYVGARGDWYPARGMQMSRFDLEFRYPQAWTLVATGKKEDERSEGTDTISHWVSERVMPLAGFNMGRYQKITAKAGNVEVEVYAAPGVETAFVRPKTVLASPPPPPMGRRNVPDEMPLLVKPLAPEPQRNAELLAAACAHAVQAYAELFGPYPYGQIALTQNPGHNSQGWPGLVFLSSYAYLSPEERSAAHLTPFENILYTDFMQWHETAHQWWGDLVAWRSYRDQWLVEALSNYSAYLVLEKQRPNDARTVLQYYRDELARKNEANEATADAGPVTLGMRLSNSHFPSGFLAVSYGRGTWLLHMLRMMMRDAAEHPRRAGKLRNAAAEAQEEPFLRGLRKLRQRFEGKEVSTEDFVKIMEEELPEGARYEGKQSLEWFVDGWINGNAMPEFKLKNVKFARKPGATLATGSIVEENAPPDLVTSLPVYAETGAGTEYVGRIFADAPETALRLTVPAGTRKLLLDPYGTVLTKP